MLERVSVPRRSLDFEDYIDILRRNFLWLLAPAFAGLVIATVIAFSKEDMYVSTAMIRIVPQQISEGLVQNVTNEQLADHINAMAETILSRNTLGTLINQYHLYQKELKAEPLEDVINAMKVGAISITPIAGVTNLSGRSLPAMQIAFRYRDRSTARAVCDELVSRLMSQNSEDTLQSNMAAHQFLEDEYQRAKHELDALDKKLIDYRTQNAG
ncbi:MAG: hypothetical protein JOZ62_03575, partial [Acidobacteriaceae bacterium]|nr:hypothetical protein [Acidobacteriaceae bacterium]